MEIRKFTVEKVWMFGEYDFYVNNKLVAKLRGQLVGSDYMFLYFLPNLYGDEDRTRIDIRYHTYNEALEQATRIVKKKLYKMATSILEDIKETEVEK